MLFSYLYRYAKTYKKRAERDGAGEGGRGVGVTRAL